MKVGVLLIGLAISTAACVPDSAVPSAFDAATGNVSWEER